MPPKGALERSAKAYGATCFAIVACVCIVLSGIAFQALRWPIGMAQLLAVSLGLLFTIMGNFLTKVRPNFIYGVRTPWTLANETVWDRTHRVAGPAMMAGGLFVLVAGLIWPAQVMLFVLIGAVGPALLTIPYSWWLWSKLPPDEKRRVRIGA
ncbi:MAG: SdpI family protein [Caulobacteraceae bacterium]